MPLLRCLILLLVVLAVGATAARAAVAPGRIVFAVDPQPPERTVDALGATNAVALPGGGVVLAGARRGTVHVAQVTAGGRLDTTFADGGLSRVELPGSEFSLLDLLRRPDGRLLLVGTQRGPARTDDPRLTVVGLRADGSLDPAFGQGGTAFSGADVACGSCAPAALAPDGSVVVTGRVGASRPGAPSDSRFVVARITPTGAPDTGFGVRTVPGTGPGDTAGYGAAVLPDGRIALLGTQGRRPLVTRLLPDGAPDPSFNGGAPQTAPVGGVELAVTGSGAATILGFDAIGRLTPDGRADAAFGGDGSVDLPGRSFGRLLLRADGEALVFRPSRFDPRPAREPAIVVDRVDSQGTIRSAGVRIGFGGGFATFLRARDRVLPSPSIVQNGFQIGDLVERPDGSFVAAGGVKIVQYAGEGIGRSSAPFAVAALAPDLQPDLAFGGSQTAPRASLRLLAQRARGAYAARGVAVRITASEPGLMLVRVRDRTGRLLAEGVQPVFRPGSRTVRVQIARRGVEVLRRGRRTPVRVTARFRDVVAGEVAARSVSGTLR